MRPWKPGDPIPQKIDENGNLHPLQLKMDKCQFLLDKMFELCKDLDRTEDAKLLIEFTISVGDLFKGVIYAMINIVTPPGMSKIEFTEDMISALEIDIIRMLKRKEAY